MDPYFFSGLTFVSLYLFCALVLALAGEDVFEVPAGPEADRGLLLASHLEAPTRKRGGSGAGSGPLDKERAFQLLFREKTIALVWGWLKRLGVPLRDRGDVSQTVFLAAYESFPTYDPRRARPERWLNQITLHIAARYRNRALHRREELTPDDPVDDADDAPGPDEQIASEQTRLLVLELLQTLDLDLRTLLIAHDIDGIPMAEIAEQRGIPLSTAYKWRSRAVAELRAVAEQRRREEERLSALLEAL